jgi:hypothetical protein
MEYGDDYGSTFGGPLPIIGNHAQRAVWQLPAYLQGEARLTAFISALAERLQTLEYCIRNVEPYLLLDFERANGVWLDLIGSLLGLPRMARDDAYYRRVLAAYAKIVHPRRRYTAGLLEGLVALIGDAADITYSPAYPRGFFLEIVGLGADDQLTWDALRLVDLATPATYNAQTRVLPDNPLRATDESGELVVVTDGVADADGEVTGPFGEVSWVY